MRTLKTKVVTIENVPGEFRVTQLAALPAARVFGAYAKFAEPLSRANTDTEGAMLSALTALDGELMDKFVPVFFANIIYVHDGKLRRLDTPEARDAYLTIRAVFELIGAQAQLSFEDF